ncbi:TraV family lipoprotein [Sphingobium chungangianum]
MSVRAASIALRGIAVATVASSLSGCIGMGGNVSGSFSCRAPDGICAPSSTIDDRALAMITGSTGPLEQPPAAGRIAAANTVPVRTGVASEVSRTQEKVLRIVLMPYVDEGGRLHEASAVRTVVETGDWKRAIVAGHHPAIAADGFGALRLQPSLAEIVDGAEAEVTAAAANLPDPAAIEAARARRDDPIGAIKSEVAARLAPKAGSAPSRASGSAPATVARLPSEGAALASPEQMNAASGEGSPAPSRTPNANGSSGPGPVDLRGTLSAVQPTPEASAAVGRLKADPRYVEAAGDAEARARDATTGSRASVPEPVVKPTVRSASFPGAIAEDQ